MWSVARSTLVPAASERAVAMSETRIIVGTIGCYPFVRGYPLGSTFMERLQAPPWPADVCVREMNWGPVAIVQELEAAPRPPDRVVLVTAVDRGTAIGTVKCRRWLGGPLDPQEMQARMFEAVTGVVHVDNLLAIGEHFRIWPDEVITVEARLPYAHVGDYVLDELTTGAATPEAIDQRPLTPAMEPVVDRLVALTRQAALEGVSGMASLMPLRAGDLTPVAEFCRNEALGGMITCNRQ